MIARSRSMLRNLLLAGCILGSGLFGCHHAHKVPMAPVDAPHELMKVKLPEYIIEPPDILSIDVLQAIPKPPYKIQSLDTIGIRVAKAAPDEPIAGAYTVDSDGTTDLGFSYGRVKVIGLTLSEAKEEIEKHLAKILKEKPVAEVISLQTRGVQQVRGAHLVRPDGSISLGTYGDVSVVGLTLTAAKQVIEEHLTRFLDMPEVIVDVASYNSKVYYVIFDGGGAGQQIQRLPVTGNDTVLDAISQLNGLSPISSTKLIWVARRSPEGDEDQILPVDWNGLTAMGKANRNYQLMPGDRVFVKAQPLVTIDNKLARFISPIERVFGFTLLGNSVVRSLQGGGGGGQGGGFNNFGP